VLLVAGQARCSIGTVRVIATYAVGAALLLVFLAVGTVTVAYCVLALLLYVAFVAMVVYDVQLSRAARMLQRWAGRTATATHSWTLSGRPFLGGDRTSSGRPRLPEDEMTVEDKARTTSGRPFNWDRVRMSLNRRRAEKLAGDAAAAAAAAAPPPMDTVVEPAGGEEDVESGGGCAGGGGGGGGGGGSRGGGGKGRGGDGADGDSDELPFVGIEMGQEAGGGGAAGGYGGGGGSASDHPEGSASATPRLPHGEYDAEAAAAMATSKGTEQLAGRRPVLQKKSAGLGAFGGGAAAAAAASAAAAGVADPLFGKPRVGGPTGVRDAPPRHALVDAVAFRVMAMADMNHQPMGPDMIEAVEAEMHRATLAVTRSQGSASRPGPSGSGDGCGGGTPRAAAAVSPLQQQQAATFGRLSVPMPVSAPPLRFHSVEGSALKAPPAGRAAFEAASADGGASKTASAQRTLHRHSYSATSFFKVRAAQGLRFWCFGHRDGRRKGVEAGGQHSRYVFLLVAG